MLIGSIPPEASGVNVVAFQAAETEHAVPFFSMSMRLPVVFGALSLLLLAAYSPNTSSSLMSAGAAADSTEWENLQVLPDSLSRPELIRIMRGFSDGLGVKCGHCHVREDGEFVFASDDRPQKEAARGMIRMVTQINTDILPTVELATANDRAESQTASVDAGMSVTCWTCHRGEATPASMPPSEGPNR